MRNIQTIKVQEFAYEAAGLSMIGSLMLPADVQPMTPGVLVLPEALGIDDHCRNWAKRIASELGFIALACDLHGEGQLLGGIEAAQASLGPRLADGELLDLWLSDTLDALAKYPNVDAENLAAMGFCMGVILVSSWLHSEPRLKPQWVCTADSLSASPEVQFRRASSPW